MCRSNGCDNALSEIAKVLQKCYYFENNTILINIESGFPLSFIYGFYWHNQQQNHNFNQKVINKIQCSSKIETKNEQS